MDNLGFVVAGYLITFIAVAGYVVHLRRRARRASQRAADLSTNR